MNKNLRRGVVALATAFACLALMASPASASVLTGTITAGTLTLSNQAVTVTDTIPLGGAGGTGCASSIEVTVTPTGSVTTWQVTAFAIIARFQLGTTFYISERTRTGSTAGTVTAVTATSAALNSAGLNLRSDVYVATNQSATATDCAHGTTRTCRFNNVSLTVQGTYNGDVNAPAVSDTASLSGSGTLGSTTPPCNAPFTTYSGGCLTISNLTGHVTGVT